MSKNTWSLSSERKPDRVELRYGGSGTGILDFGTSLYGLWDMVS